jgi:hypothetical protein
MLATLAAQEMPEAQNILSRRIDGVIRRRLEIELRRGHAAILRFPQQQIDNPAATDVRTRRMAMLKDIGVGAAGFLQRISQDLQQIEAAVVIDGLGELRDSAVAPG